MTPENAGTDFGLTNALPEVKKEVPLPARHLVLILKQTDDEVRDLSVLNDVTEVLKEYPGRDDVSISIDSEGRVVNMRLSKIFVRNCPELKERLVGIVGEKNMRLEEITG